MEHERNPRPSRSWRYIDAKVGAPKKSGVGGMVSIFVFLVLAWATYQVFT